AIVPSKFRSRVKFAALVSVNAESTLMPSRERLLCSCVTFTCAFVGTAQRKAAKTITTREIKGFMERLPKSGAQLRRCADSLSRTYGSAKVTSYEVVKF